MNGPCDDAFSPRAMPWLMGAGAAFLYLSFPAARYNFDGVACAIAVDTADLRHLVHGNHLAYGLLGYWWFSLWRWLGYEGPALFSLQALSSVFGAAGVGALAHLLLRLGLRPRLAALAALGMAVSEYYWVWSLESQVYLLGALFMILAVDEALSAEPRPVVLGLLHAGAVLGHVGHVMLAPAIVFLLGRDRKKIVTYVGSAAAALIAAYALAGAFCVRPRSWEEVRVWLLGSAALSADRSFNWHGHGPLQSLSDWIDNSSRMWGGGQLSSLFAAAFAAFGACATTRRRVARAGLLWLASYALLFMAWEPHTAVYRVSDLAPLWLLMALGAEVLAARAEKALIVFASFVAFLGVWNLSQVVRPNADPKNNIALQTALTVAGRVPENAWVVAGSMQQIYIPYFAHRRPIDPRYYDGRETLLADRLRKHLDAGEPVYLMLATLTPPWQAWFHALPIEDLGGAGDGRLHRLTPPSTRR